MWIDTISGSDVCVVPVALEAAAALGDWGQISGQTDGGAEELRRPFSLERCLAFQQDLESKNKLHHNVLMLNFLHY